jgi:hypothetical protein
MRDDDHPIRSDTDAIGDLVRATAQTVEASPALRARVAEQRGRARSRRRLMPALAGALTAVAAVVVLTVAGGGTTGPTVADAAGLALARPTAPAPAPAAASREGHVLQAQEGGIRFPDYGWRWDGWRTTGVRRDRVGGRHMTTVTYRGPRGDVGYTIVGGAPLAVPKGTRTVHRGYEAYTVLRRDGATVVTWREDGHTCVVAGRGATAAELIRLAAWEG